MLHDTATLTTSDGHTLHRQWWFPDGEPKAVIMLVHGLGEHAGRYGHVAERLVGSGYAVEAIDHRGHGRSSGDRAFVRGYDELMSDMSIWRATVAGAHPDLPLFVLGHSMGGNLAVGHALAEPDGIAGLVLSGPALEVGDDLAPWKLTIFSLVAKVAPKVRPEALSADAISRDPAVVEAYRNDPLVYTGKISAGMGAALIGAMQSFPDRYHELEMPILLLHGTDDQLANIEGSRTLERSAVNAAVTASYYDGLFHEVFNEPEQDRVLDDLVEWLDTTTGTIAS